MHLEIRMNGLTMKKVALKAADDVSGGVAYLPRDCSPGSSSNKFGKQPVVTRPQHSREGRMEGISLTHWLCMVALTGFEPVFSP